MDRIDVKLRQQWVYIKSKYIRYAYIYVHACRFGSSSGCSLSSLSLSLSLSVTVFSDCKKKRKKEPLSVCLMPVLISPCLIECWPEPENRGTAGWCELTFSKFRCHLYVTNTHLSSTVLWLISLFSSLGSPDQRFSLFAGIKDYSKRHSRSADGNLPRTLGIRQLVSAVTNRVVLGVFDVTRPNFILLFFSPLFILSSFLMPFYYCPRRQKWLRLLG